MDSIIVSPEVLASGCVSYFIDTFDRPLPCYVGTNGAWVDSTDVIESGGSFAFYIVYPMESY